MKKIINDQKWHSCDDTFVSELSACTTDPGKLFQADSSKLPSSMLSMPGIENVYLSGYVDPVTIQTGELSGCGEYVVTRTEDNLRKAYNYAIGIDDDGDYFYAGPFKYFDTHHEPLSGEILINQIFGHTEINLESNESEETE